MKPLDLITTNVNELPNNIEAEQSVIGSIYFRMIFSTKLILL